MEGIFPFLVIILAAALAALVVWELLPERRTLRAGATGGMPERGEGYAVAGQLPRLQVVHAADDGTLYGVDAHHLFVSRDGGRSFSRRGTLPPAAPGAIGLRLRCSSRMRPAPRAATQRALNSCSNCCGMRTSGTP